MANKLQFNKKDISQIEQMIVRLVRDEIRKQQLIDTGLMLRSVEAKLKIKGNSFTIDITSTEYFKYVDGDYKILDNVFKGRDYEKLILPMIEQLFVDAFEKQLDE